MTPKLQVRTVRLELLRQGPPHNQLLSPLTPYLATCGDSGAGVVHVPYEHADFERRLIALRYADGASEDRLATLRSTGIEVARMLALVPGLPGALTADAGQNTMIHLRVTLSASELALLPFELSKLPTTLDGSSEAWLALQTRPPVCITRHIRTVASDGVVWPTKPRVLFIAGPTDDIPFVPHQRVLETVIAPFSYPKSDEPVQGVDARHTHYGERLTIIANASLDDVVTECRARRYTHVHILAHGAVDTSSKGRPFGIRLRGRQGGAEVVSGERFATALATVDGSAIHRPSVVSLASCDSGHVASVIEPAPGASFAHTVHQSGIPLVVASQFPLTKEGSVTVASLLYEGLLTGQNPWALLHQLRSELHSRYGANCHDWASLVAYEALPRDIEAQIEALRYEQGRLRLNAALQRVDLAVDEQARSNQTVDHATLFADVEGAIAALPNEGVYAMECLGLEASAMKRLAQAVNSEASNAGGDQDLLAQSCGLLERAAAHYRRASNLFLLNAEGAVQRKASLHWVVVQELSLRAVLGDVDEGGLWDTGFLCATTYLDHPESDERAFAHASLLELWLVRLALADSPALAERAASKVREHATSLARLYPTEDAFPLSSTRKQLERYVNWWGGDPFSTFVESSSRRMRRTWKDRTSVLNTAAEAIRILSAKVLVTGAAPKRQPAVESAARRDAAPPAPAPDSSTLAAPAKRPGRRTSTDRSQAFLEIHMLPAQHGDCLWIEYGTDPRRTSRVLIDCGTKRTNTRLMAKIDRLPPDERALELFVLTHIDDDHIGGAIPFLEGEAGGLKIGDVWFNGYKHLSELLGAVQGERFSTLIDDLQLPWNRWREGKAIVVADSLPEHELPGGLSLTLLSPTAERLDDLRKRWEKEVDAKGFKPGERIDAEDLLGGDDTSTDVDELAARPFKSDKAPPNGSSIALLAEFEGKSVLFAADAHPPVLERSIQSLLQARRQDRLTLDAFKVSHHASHGNTSPELLELLDCPRYLVSTNGDKFRHPHRETIGRIIKLGGPRPQLFFNYVSDENKVWAAPELQEQYGYSATYPENGEGLVVRL